MKVEFTSQFDEGDFVHLKYAGEYGEVQKVKYGKSGFKYWVGPDKQSPRLGPFNESELEVADEGDYSEWMEAKAVKVEPAITIENPFTVHIQRTVEAVIRDTEWQYRGVGEGATLSHYLRALMRTCRAQLGQIQKQAAQRVVNEDPDDDLD